MAKRSLASMWLRTLQRTAGAAARSGLESGLRAAKRAAKHAAKQAATQTAKAARVAAKPAARRRATAEPVAVAAPALPAVATRRTAGPPTPRAGTPAGDLLTGIAIAPAGARRYHLFRPPPGGTAAGPSERLPLLVMLHGCTQDAADFARSTQMNRIAARERCFVLYPEQDRQSNPQTCWNWFATRSGQAQREAAILASAVDQVCRLYQIDRERVALAGLSAGAGMAALMAVLQPGRYRAVVMHSGVAPGSAQSAASAIAAMRGRRGSPSGLLDAVASAASANAPLPPLLVIHGSDDRTVVPSNGRAAAEAWAAAMGAGAGVPRTLRRGQRHPAQITDFRRAGRICVSLCEVDGLGHAWSGGDARQPFGDAAGPDASRMVWAFAARQFAAGA